MIQNANRNKMLFNILSMTVLVITVVIGLSFTCVADTATAVNVYIDPSFGGKETGPLMSSNKYAKELTLEYAKALKRKLEVRGIATRLSRENDKHIYLEDRLLGAIREKNPEANRKTVLFISIRISDGRGKDCIRIYYPDKERMLSELSKRKYTSLQGKVIGNSIAKAKIEDAVKGSVEFAKLVITALKNDSFSICIDDLPGSDYILNNTEIPTVILDFAVSDLASPIAYIHNEILIDKIIKIIATSTEEYLSVTTAK